jgi:dipeptidase E
MKSLFLISSSRYQGGEFWAHCFDALKKFLGEPENGRNCILFLPQAHPDEDYDGYTKVISGILSKLGYEVIGAHTFEFPSRDCFLKPFVDTICAVCVGGGNTWLLKNKTDYDMFLQVNRMVTEGKLKYISASAGTVMACPSMLTTNDMPPVLPQNSDGFNLVPFQINPHFVKGALVEKHMGETREERIRQVIVHHPDWLVVGLPEGCWIEGHGEEYILRGTGQAIIFRKGGGNGTIWLPGEPISETGML